LLYWYKSTNSDTAAAAADVNNATEGNSTALTAAADVNNATEGNSTALNASAGGGGTGDPLAPAGEGGGGGVTLPESEGVDDENEKKMLLMKIGDTACVVSEWVS
jgi:hypothetical protein